MTFLPQEICTCWSFYLEHAFVRYSLVHILLSTGPLLKCQYLREGFLHNPIWCWTSPPFPVTFYIHFSLNFSSFFFNIPFILLIYSMYCLSFPIEWKFQKGEDFGLDCHWSVISAGNHMCPIWKCLIVFVERMNQGPVMGIWWRACWALPVCIRGRHRREMTLCWVLG